MFGTIFWFRRIFDIEELDGQENKILAVYNNYHEDVKSFFKANDIPYSFWISVKRGNGKNYVIF